MRNLSTTDANELDAINGTALVAIDAARTELAALVLPSAVALNTFDQASFEAYLDSWSAIEQRLPASQPPPPTQPAALFEWRQTFAILYGSDPNLGPTPEVIAHNALIREQGDLAASLAATILPTVTAVNATFRDVPSSLDDLSLELEDAWRLFSVALVHATSLRVALTVTADLMASATSLTSCSWLGRTFDAVVALTCDDGTSLQAQSTMIGWLGFAAVTLALLCMMLLLCVPPRAASGGWLTEAGNAAVAPTGREASGERSPAVCALQQRTNLSRRQSSSEQVKGGCRAFAEIQLPAPDAINTISMDASAQSPSSRVRLSTSSGLPRVVATPLPSSRASIADAGGCAAAANRAGRCISAVAPRASPTGLPACPYDGRGHSESIASVVEGVPLYPRVSGVASPGQSCNGRL